MGGYYNEPTDSVPRKDFDHMIFGLACVERRIDLIPEDPFIVLDIMDETTKDDEASSTMRLAKYLVERREDLVTSQRVVIIGSSWISLLVARLGATSIVARDEEQNETRLQILQHMDQCINRPTTCPVQTTTNGEYLDDSDLIIINVLVAFLSTPLASNSISNRPFHSNIWNLDPLVGKSEKSKTNERMNDGIHRIDFLQLVMACSKSWTFAVCTCPAHPRREITF
jgi:hypothetical protein